VHCIKLSFNFFESRTNELVQFIAHKGSIGTLQKSHDAFATSGYNFPMNALMGGSESASVQQSF
jgi:hypothetical protein